MPAKQSNLFYQRDLLVSEVQGQCSTSLLRLAHTVMGVLKARALQRVTGLAATDEQGTPLRIQEGDLPHDTAFTAYGQSNTLPEGLIGFKGKHPSTITSHYLLGNGYRAYNPALMRFNSPDSWSPFGAGGLNAYAFVLGDPVNGSDPSGHAVYAKVRIIKPGLHVFYKRSGVLGRKEELRVHAHGSPGHIWAGNDPLNAREFANLLKQNNIDPGKHKTRFYACYSATKVPQTGKSFIDDFSKITGQPATGFDGVTNTDRAMFPPKQGETLPSMEFSLTKKNPYKPGDEYFTAFTSTPITVTPLQDSVGAIRSKSK